MMRTLCIGFALALFAGSTAATSLFGFAYFGDDERSFDARIEGKGGAGIAQRDSLNAAVKSPTQLLDLERVTLTFVGNWQRRNSEDAFGDVSRSFVQVPTLRIGLPLGDRFAAGIGFNAMRATQWTSVGPSSVDPDVIETKTRGGTQFAFPIQLAARLHEKLRVAAGLVYEGGTIRSEYEAELNQGVVDPAGSREDTMESWTYELAASAHDLGPVSVGAYYVPEHDADIRIDIDNLARDANETLSRTDTRPARWGVGAEIVLGSGWSVAADLENEEWSGYRGRSFEDENGEPVSLDDESVWRLGVEHLPARRSTGLRSVPWRAGYYQRRWHYGLGGTPVDEWGFTLGTSVGFRIPNARTDVALSYGRIGDLDENGASESVLRLTISVSGGERWY